MREFINLIESSQLAEVLDPRHEENALFEGVIKIDEKIIWSNPQYSQVMALVDRYIDLRAIIVGSDVYFGDASIWTHYQMFKSLQRDAIVAPEWRFPNIILIVIAPKKQRVDSLSYGHPYRFGDDFVFYASGRYRDAKRVPNFARVIPNYSDNSLLEGDMI